MNLRRVLLLLGRLFFGAMFVYAAYSKILHPTLILHPWFAFKFAVKANLTNFAGEVATFQFLSASSSALLAHILPFAELALGLLLLIGWRARYWFAGISFLLMVFLTVLTRAYLLHLDIKDCGCFATPEPLTGMKLVKDGLLLAVALACTFLAFVESRSPHPWSAPANAEPR